MQTLYFNRDPVVVGKSIEQPTQELVKNTLGLWNVSPEDALKYGGDLTRAAMGAINLRNDHKYVVVDTKVHMLKPGMWPAPPGWHTDATPREVNGQPSFDPSNGRQHISWQDREDAIAPRMHLLVTGAGCLTEFFTPDIELDVPDDGDNSLFKVMTRKVNDVVNHQRYGDTFIFTSPSCTVVEWNWWDIHRGVVATQSEWRFLIRVTETDYQAPQTDPRAFIRTQQNVYVPSEEFSW
jgi:hypothetical protein